MNLNSSANHQHSNSDYLHTRHVKKLQIDLNVPASSNETQELLTHKVPSSDDEALSQYAGMGIRRTESPHPSSGRPHSDGYDHDHGFKDSNHKDASRKKKSSGSSISKWKQQVKVSPEIGLEVPPNDGYMWRKYGQKEILNAKYPREYYRCTYRSTHGCCATKQVQRSTDDPSIFEITYLGNHTCPKITKTTDSSAAVESAYGLINFSSPLESASATSRTPDCSAATKPTSTVTRNSFELSNWSQDHN